MEASLHAHDWNTAQMAEDHLASMSLNGADRKIGNRFVGKCIAIGQLIGKRTQTRAADYADFRPQFGALQQKIGDQIKRFVRISMKIGKSSVIYG